MGTTEAERTPPPAAGGVPGCQLADHVITSYITGGIQTIEFEFLLSSLLHLLFVFIPLKDDRHRSRCTCRSDC
jgi:hypothetical protein